MVQQAAARMTLEDVRTQFLEYALDTSGEAVAIMRLSDGLPKLLSVQAFSALCEQLAAHLEGSEVLDAADLPVLLQAWFPPCLDLRYVTSYTNDGVNISCHTFQRRFSRRYLPYRPAAGASLQPGVLATVPAGTQGAGPASAVGSAGGGATAPPGALETSPASAAVAAHPIEAGGSDAVVLDDRELVDMERSLDKALGPVDPTLKMAARKAVHGLVQYVQRAHLLTIRSLVCEFVRDSWGNLHFMGPLRVDWASVIPGGARRCWDYGLGVLERRPTIAGPHPVRNQCMLVGAGAGCPAADALAPMMAAAQGGGGSPGPTPTSWAQQRRRSRGPPTLPATGLSCRRSMIRTLAQSRPLPTWRPAAAPGWQPRLRRHTWRHWHGQLASNTPEVRFCSLVGRSHEVLPGRPARCHPCGQGSLK